MIRLSSMEFVIKDTADAVIIPLKGSIVSLNDVYLALLGADVDPITGKCSNYDYIRQQIVEAHELLEQSEQAGTSWLQSLYKNLEELTQDGGELDREMKEIEQTLDNLRTKQKCNEKLLKESEGALDQARTNLNSAKQTLQDQEKKQRDATIVTGVGTGLMAIPIVGWVPGAGMIVGGGIALGQANQAVQVAQEEVGNSETEMRKYQDKVCDYNFTISQAEQEIGQKNYELKQRQELIQKAKKLIESVAEFQEKVGRAVSLLGVLSRRVKGSEHHTRILILQEPVIKVIEDVMTVLEQITGIELLYSYDLPKLIDQMKENHQRLVDNCASENFK